MYGDGSLLVQGSVSADSQQNFDSCQYSPVKNHHQEHTCGWTELGSLTCCKKEEYTSKGNVRKNLMGFWLVSGDFPGVFRKVVGLFSLSWLLPVSRCNAVIVYLDDSYLEGEKDGATLKRWLVKKQQLPVFSRMGRCLIVLRLAQWPDFLPGLRQDYEVVLFFVSLTVTEWLCLMLESCEITSNREPWLTPNKLSPSCGLGPFLSVRGHFSLSCMNQFFSAGGRLKIEKRYKRICKNGPHNGNEVNDLTLFSPGRL